MQTIHTPPLEILAQIVVNRQPIAQFLCSPRDLQALAYGWLYTQGVIDSPGEIATIRACHKSGMIRVRMPSFDPGRLSGFRTALSSGCGGGRVGLDQYGGEWTPLDSECTIDHAALAQHMDAMYRQFRSSSLWEGMHCAAIARAETPAEILLASDIGRHNAVDKAIGRGLLAGWDFGLSALATSGRISSDMILKARRAGIPIVISQHSVTSMAIEIARAAGIALISRFGRRDEERFGETRRIVGPAVGV